MTANTTFIPDTSSTNVFVGIFSEPNKAFEAIEQRPRAWLPLLMLVISTVVLLAWYYQVVDFPWLQDKIVATMKDVAAREKAKQFISKNMMLTTSVIGGAIIIPVMSALTALYFLVVSKIKNLGISYGKWFALVCWAALPSVLLLPLGAMQILMSHGGQLEPGQLNPVSLNSLLFHLEMGSRGASLLDSVSLISFWNMFLMVVGFRSWSKLPRSTSTVLALLPYIVIYGVWAMISLMSKAA